MALPCALCLPLRSVTIKSPYVADVQLADGSVALAHAPGMELGGVCVAGARVLLSRNAAGGTTKTAFAIQLVAAEGCWVGAHPALGNRLAAEALRRGLLGHALGAHVSQRAEVTHGRSRVDFELTDAAGGRTLVEVKSVVCSDYPAGSRARRPKSYDLIYSQLAEGPAYQRAAVFPVGKLGQKLEDGTKCVSERAIKHVRELSSLQGESGGALKAALLFVVNRGDCHSVSVRRGSCPALAKAAARAADEGVAFHALRVKWSASGEAHFDGMLPVDVGSCLVAAA